ncbi:GNAT family N-acetyltransferase [Roseibium sp.]|uniref:GNAT family N-acetyltransferase n=1 Tax=Roseibium sp. TaxID=1936156 RepID=UPI003B50D465
MPLKLRPATLEDAPALTDILHRAKASWGYPEDKMAEFMDVWGISETTIRSIEMTVAETQGVPIAFLGVVPDDGETLLVDFLFVDPGMHGKGIGSLLVKRAEDAARQLQLTRLRLEADAHAGDFYEKHGFQTYATRPSEMSPGKHIPLMEKRLPACVHELKRIDLRVTDRPWRFETENATEIAAHFEEAQKRISLLWNGRTLKLTHYAFQDGIFEGSCSESSYAAHLAWRDWGAPDATAFNLFGSAIIRSGDGALLYGVMGPHTATGGMIYPPGGNLDLNDVKPDGTVDVIRAIDRELAEETGLCGAAMKKAALLATFDGPRISIARVFDCDDEAAALRAAILAHSAASEEKELSDIRIIRSRDDLQDPAIVPFAREIAHYLLQ